MMVVLSVYDSKADSWMMPLFAPNVAVATRMWAEAVQTPGSPFNKFPGDFTMFTVGEWDELTGELKPYQAKANLGVATQYLHTPGSPAMREEAKQLALAK